MADSIAQSSERVRSQALDDAESLGSPIVTVVTKRIRAAKKHLTKIERIEAKALEQPDKMDKDQKETLGRKSKDLANIEELEKLIPLLKDAKAAEINVAVSKAVEKALAEERANIAAQAPPTPVAPEGLNNELRSEIESKTVNRLLHLLYFSQTFDFQKPGEMTKLERNACLSYYNHHYQDKEELLTPEDLLIMCKLGNLLVSRPMTECISHAEALQQAHSLAMQWLHPTASQIASLDNNTMEQVSKCLECVMASDYITVRPVLAEPEVETPPESAHPPGNGHTSQSGDDHASHSERPPCQESHVFSDVTHPTDTSPTQSPPQHGSSQPHYTQANPQDHSYPQTEQEEHGYYPEPQSQSRQEGGLAGHDGNNGEMGSHASYAAPHQALPNGQTHHAQSAASMNFMTNSTVANNGRSGSIQLLEQGSNASARPSQQQPFQTDVPDSTYTNGHIPPHATNGTSGDSEGRTVPSHAERQGSYGSGQRGDGWEPERQGSHGRGAGERGYEGSAPRGRGGPRGGGGHYQGGRGGAGRGGAGRGRASRGGRSDNRSSRGSYGNDTGGRGSQAMRSEESYQRGHQQRPEPQSGY
ncbi:hypothetical protein WJX82_003190 [Trebouxia sp. C0006]